MKHSTIKRIVSRPPSYRHADPTRFLITLAIAFFVLGLLAGAITRAITPPVTSQLPNIQELDYR